MIRKTISVILLVTVCLNINLSFSQTPQMTNKYTFFLTGASFAVELNGWFEVGCKSLGVNSINKAVGGTTISDMANLMSKNELYTFEELEEMDALIIMHVINQDVYDESRLKENYKEYELPFERKNGAEAFDYVIKRYLTECYNLRFKKNSKYFETELGKPAVIILCSDWHDARKTYNSSIRKLANKWGLPLIEFDKYIGFSKGTNHPVTQEKISTLYSFDRQTIEGVEYGWHPNRGEDNYIQLRMAAIFTDTMRRIFYF